MLYMFKILSYWYRVVQWLYPGHSSLGSWQCHSEDHERYLLLEMLMLRTVVSRTQWGFGCHAADEGMIHDWLAREERVIYQELDTARMQMDC